MKRAMKLAAACTGLLLFVVGQAAAGAGAPHVGTWNVEQTAATSGDEIFAVGASSASDVWAVGRENTGDTSDLWAEHSDGSSWIVTPIPAEPSAAQSWLDAVAVLAPTDAWAIGSGDDSSNNTTGLVRHWDGSTWSAVPFPQDTGWSENAAVQFVAPDDGWLVGAAGPSSIEPISGFIDHWNGTSWIAEALPADLCGGESYIYDVTASSPADAWAVGSCGSSPVVPLALHWDGSTWSQVTIPVTDGDTYAFISGVAAISATDIWVDGEESDPSDIRPVMEHFDGSSWTEVSVPAGIGESYLSSLAGVSSGDVWAMGKDDQGQITEHYDGSSWTLVPGVGPDQLGNVTSLSAGILWAVDGRKLESLVESEVLDSGFAATRIITDLGKTVAWHLGTHNRARHSVTDATGLGLFDSGKLRKGLSFLHRYGAAGTYEVTDVTTGAQERIGVKPTAVPGSGDIGVTWATDGAPAGYVYDVQVEAPGGSFVSWEAGVTFPSAVFTSSTSGTFRFRARLRRVSDGAASGWSPGVSATA